MVSKIKSSLLFSQQSLPWPGVACLLSLTSFHQFQLGNTKLFVISCRHQLHVSCSFCLEFLSSTPFHLCSALGSSGKLSSAARQGQVPLTYYPITASKQLFLATLLFCILDKNLSSVFHAPVFFYNVTFDKKMSKQRKRRRFEVYFCAALKYTLN